MDNFLHMLIRMVRQDFKKTKYLPEELSVFG